MLVKIDNKLLIPHETLTVSQLPTSKVVTNRTIINLEVNQALVILANHPVL
jgi:hypothetical protein